MGASPPQVSPSIVAYPTAASLRLLVASSNAPRKNVVIQFTDATLHPTQARIYAGGNVAWTNYSSGLGVVFIPEDTARQLGCSSMRPLFARITGGYRSEVIRPDSENVTLPCSPPSGTYQYELRLFANGLDVMDVGNPDSLMWGTIVVGRSRRGGVA